MPSNAWQERLPTLFAAVDKKDLVAFSAFLHDDAVMRFGNGTPMQGKATIVAGLTGFLSSVERVSHQIRRVIEADDVVVCELTVTYTRHDGTELTLPSASVLRVSAGRIEGYHAFRDISSLHRS